MKQWKQPEMLEVEIAETEHDLFGVHLDGGFTGDGDISGHMTFDGDECVGSVTSKLTGKTYTCKICKPENSPS